MVNYIRKNQTSPEEILQAKSCFWNEEAYLKPSDESRLDWLMFGRALSRRLSRCYSNPTIHTDFEESYNSEEAKSSGKSSAMVQISQLELNELQSRSNNLEAEVKLLNSVLEDMRKEFRVHSDKLIQELESTPDESKNCVSSVKVADDEEYFNTYAHYDIHQEMLSVRNCALI